MNKLAKREQAISSESEQQQTTTGDQRSNPKHIWVDEKEPAALVGEYTQTFLSSWSSC